MTKRPTPTNGKPSALDDAKFTPTGDYPDRLDTVTAEVLMRLLNYETLTSLDGVYDANTTRLSAVVFYIEQAYGWTIDRRDMATGCKDGRVAWVKEYFFDPRTIEAALAAGAGAWCSDVRRARAALRKQAAEAERRAVLANMAAATARRRAQPGQSDLFAGAMA